MNAGRRRRAGCRRTCRSSVRPIVTAGLAKLVDDVNQYAARDVAAPRRTARPTRDRERTTPRMTRQETERGDDLAEPQRRPTTGACVESVDGIELEHEVGDDRAGARADDLGGDVGDRDRGSMMPPSSRSASVTTGLKWAPETEPNARISATSPPAVAIEFSSSCRPTSSGESRSREDPRTDDDGDEQRRADAFGRGPAAERGRVIGQQQRAAGLGR